MNKNTILIGLLAAAAACAPAFAHTDQGKAKGQASSIIPGGSGPYGGDSADGLGASLDLFHVEDIVNEETVAGIVRTTRRNARTTPYDVEVDVSGLQGGTGSNPGGAAATAVPTPGGAALFGLAGLLAARRRRR